LDLDVLDPAYFPGTGTPEPGGVTFKELLAAILKLKKLKNFVGADMMELSPQYDTSGASTAAACKALREIVLLLHQERGHE
ncbi:MAG: arginase family protein, partial [Bacilli bacterium]|nr:arginase family protein [Bacilli bacterium]